jgi:hypothetical protein
MDPLSLFAQDHNNVVYTVPMDSETVSSRLMDTDTKRAILANMRAAARGEANEYNEESAPVEAPQPQPSPQQQELPPPPPQPPPPQHQPQLHAASAPSISSSSELAGQSAAWGLDCGSLGWLVGAVEAEPKPPKSSRSPLPRVSLLTRTGLPRATIAKGGNGFRVKVPGSVRARRGS